MVIAWKILIGKPEGKGTLGRSRHTWAYNIKLLHNETGYEDVDQIQLDQGRVQCWALVNTVMNLRIP
jgi:hypothetical protein